MIHQLCLDAERHVGRGTGYNIRDIQGREREESSLVITVTVNDGDVGEMTVDDGRLWIFGEEDTVCTREICQSERLGNKLVTGFSNGK
jgi:hypothetical protein